MLDSILPTSVGGVMLAIVCKTWDLISVKQ